MNFYLSGIGRRDLNELLGEEESGFVHLSERRKI